MQPDHNQSPYTIEARSLSVAGIAGHDFWVLRDDSGRPIAELHGLATERASGQHVAIGTDPERYSLRAWHFAHSREYATSIGMDVSNETYIGDGQPSRTVLSGPKDEVLARWNHAVSMVPQLNALDLNYPANGIQLFGKTVNSNSTYRTLGEIMDLPVQGFRGRIEPGLDNRMLPREEIETLRYRPDVPPQERHQDATPQPPSRNQQGALHSQGDATRNEHAADDMAPTDSSHPDHRYFTLLRDALPARIGDHEVAYAMLKAKQDGVTDAAQLDVTRTTAIDRSIFVSGTIPGFRSRVDLPDTLPTLAVISTQLEHANRKIAQHHVIEPPQRERALQV